MCGEEILWLLIGVQSDPAEAVFRQQAVCNQAFDSLFCAIHQTVDPGMSPNFRVLGVLTRVPVHEVENSPIKVRDRLLDIIVLGQFKDSSIC